MKERTKILSVFGTRPEAIKMAPIVKSLENNHKFLSKVCITAQHREMLDYVLDVFKINPHYDLDVMKSSQELHQITSSIITGLIRVLDEFSPDVILVHGDTATTFAASLAAFYKKIAVGHVEAGLRTGNIFSPWPEEANRKLTSVIANLHFAPTDLSRNNLLREGYSPEDIYITGNTVIDALNLANNIIRSDKKLEKKFYSEFNFLDFEKKIILITGHRRESFGKGFSNICNAIAQLANNNPQIQFVYPVHLNPNVLKPVNDKLTGIKNVFLISPLRYLSFVFLMNNSYLILTDSGGIQEEAPSLGKPVILMRDNTERPEAIEAGTVKLVGAESSKIFDSVQELLDNPESYRKMSLSHNPYGDGSAAKKIIHILEKRFYVD
jgi:UDP-N-acetylglucosamine 2-epimerase (non-hydrolysing)